MKLVFTIIICLLLLQLINFFYLFTIVLVLLGTFSNFSCYIHLDTNTAKYFKMPSNSSSKSSFIISNNAGVNVMKKKSHQKFIIKSLI